MQSNTVNLPKAPGRRFYTWAALSALLIAFTGFSRSYYLKEVFGTHELSILLHVHGVVMTLWLLVFVAQVRLVAVRRVDLHRRLGKWGIALACLILFVAPAAAIVSAKDHLVTRPSSISFLAVQLGDIVVFAILIALGWAYRWKRDFHARFMLLANFCILPSAIVRVLILFAGTNNVWLMFGVNDLCVLILLIWDTAKYRQLHPAFKWGTLLVVVTQPLRMIVGWSPIWIESVRWILT